MDKYARQTYEANFMSISPELFDNNNFVGDITKIDKSTIPDFDILTGGFPCQPFSQAGLKRGFDDTRGTLFYEIADILKVKQPEAFFLENVRGLLKHDNGKTIETISDVLTKDLGYSLKLYIVKASDHGLPQLRTRLFMIGFKDKDIVFEPPPKRELLYNMSDIFGATTNREIGFTLRVGGRRSGLHDRRNWDTYLVDGTPRSLTPTEAKKMQGFPDKFIFPVSDNQAMKQLGNSVAILAVQDYAQQIINNH